MERWPGRQLELAWEAVGEAAWEAVGEAAWETAGEVGWIAVGTVVITQLPSRDTLTTLAPAHT